MATINGLTAERMQEIIDKTIVDADVVGDNLILTLEDATEIDAGNVRGPAGTPGAQDVEDQIADALNLADPPGTPKAYTGAAAPEGHGLCDAVGEHSSATYPLLAVLYGTGAGCINGASTAGTFRLPNLKGRILVGKDAAVSIFDTLHEVGGSRDSVVVSHDHTASSDQAAHDHGGSSIGAGGVDHSHGTGDGGAHDHSVDGGDFGDRIVVSAGTAGGQQLAPSGGYDVYYTNIDAIGNHNHGQTGGATAYSHGHGITIASNDPAITTTVNANGVSGTDANVQPYRVINWIMRLA